jgi:hypothetical protein
MKTLTTWQAAILAVLFVALLVLPTVYQRWKFARKPASFDSTPLRDKVGLNLHHGHFGIPMAFIGTFMLILLLIIGNMTEHVSLVMMTIKSVFVPAAFVSVILSGFGWGLMLDEIIPMLVMPSLGRKLELEVYAGSRNSTFLLVGGIAFFLTVLFLLIRFL